MNRALSVFLITAALASFGFAGLGFGSAQQPSTQVSGVLTHDTTWGKQGSPYVFSGAVGVPIGVTLTVEAGATVDLGNYYLQVNGTLNVEGTASEKVTLKSSENQTGGPAVDYVNTAPIGGGRNIVIAYGNPTCSIDYAVLDHTSIFGAGLYSSAKLSISSSVLASSDVNNYGSTAIKDSYVTGAVRLDGASTVTGNVLLGGVTVTGYPSGDRTPGTFLVSGNNITNPVGAAVNAAGSGAIKDNIIWGSDRGITQEDNTVLSAAIQGNLILKNKFGLYLRDSKDDAIVKDNTFTANQVGIFNPDSQMTIKGNNFVDNSLYDVQAGASAVDAGGNWWGTADGAMISQKIFDANDDFSLGTVIYMPYLTSANPNAPGSPTDLMLPEASASPTDGVTFQTVNHPAVLVGGLEVGVVVAVVIVMVSAAVLVFRARRKRA
jgi:parallel beta-helix repeat protein